MNLKKIIKNIIKKLDCRRINYNFYNEFLEYKIFGGFFENPKKETAYVGDLSINYNEEREKLIEWKKENDSLKSFLSELPDNLKVLDVPFGTGRYIDFYIEKKFEIYGVDLSNDMLNNAKNYLKEKYNYCKLQVGDASNMNFNDAFFDLVVCSRFLPHIISFETALQTIKEISRLTSKYAIIQIGFRHKKYRRLRKPYKNEKMGTWFYENEVYELLRKNKLKVIDKSEILHPGVTLNKKYFRNPKGWYFLLCEKVI